MVYIVLVDSVITSVKINTTSVTSYAFETEADIRPVRCVEHRKAQLPEYPWIGKFSYLDGFLRVLPLVTERINYNMEKQTKKRIKYLIASLCCAVILGIGLQTPMNIQATSATLTFSADKKTVSVGDTFYVVIILDSSEKIGGFEGYLSYDSNQAEFVSGGSHVNGDDGILRINDVDSAETAKTKKYSLKFKAKKTGDCVFDTSEAPAIYDESGDLLSVSSNKLTVSIEKSQSLSSNNKLSKLLISPGELNQEYSNDISAYKVEIPYESDMLFISAEPKDKDAIVTVDGNEDLKVGTNYVHVIVAAPSGAKRDVQIEVTRLEEGTAPSTEEEEVQTGVTISKDKDKNDILTSKHIFKITKMEDDIQIPEGYETTSITIDGQNLTAYAVANDLKNEYVLLYLTNENGENGFYRYDRIEKTIQRYESAQNNNTKNDPLEQEDGKKDALNAHLILIGAMAGLIIILSISLAVVVMKNKNRKEKL